MNVDVVVGIVLIGLGCMTLAARFLGWEQMLLKRQPMKDRFGDRIGDTIHFVAYSVLPIVCGLLFAVG